MLQITRHNATTMRKRGLRIPPFEHYLHHIETLLWDRFNKLMDMNVDSVRAAANSAKMGTVDIRPHYVLISLSAIHVLTSWFTRSYDVMRNFVRLF
jgi:hypothetical protein